MAKSSSKTSSKTSRSTSSNGASRKSSNGTAKKAASKSAKPEADSHEELNKLFEHALKDMYWVEKALTKAIPKMIKKAEANELVSALKNHLKETEGQVTKLEKIFDALGKTARAKKCVGMEGILKEGEELMTEFEGPVLDAAIIAAGQKVEHYEISSYMSMITLARALDMPKEADILQQILNQEMESDKVLGNIAIQETHAMLAGTKM